MNKTKRLKMKRLQKKISLCMVVVIAILCGANGDLLGNVTKAYKLDVKASSLQIKSEDMTESTQEPECSPEVVTPAPDVTSSAAVTATPEVTGNDNGVPKGEPTPLMVTAMPGVVIIDPTPIVFYTSTPLPTEIPRDDMPLPTATATAQPTEEPKGQEAIATQMPVPSTTLPPDSISDGSRDCIVSYVMNGGTNSDKNPTHVYGAGQKLYSPSKAGYKFEGWYKESLCIHKTTVIDPEGKSEVTYYAKWKKVVVGQAKILKVTRLKNGKIKVKVKKETGASGYQYVYSTFANMSLKSFVVSSKNPKTLSKTKKKCKYYIMVRIYKLDSCKRRIYGKYSKIKLIK
ncbi:MAG: InlB B-repeat-containing protein [Lachnospiraceae bacterium]|nr:InlB B-repeat-containing protein [Lachnospiraceae bacterium]